MRVYTQGSFDLLHEGHINLLRRCRQLADASEVVVSVLSDESYTAYRGHPPFMPFLQRKIVIESLKYVDRVIEGDSRNTKQELQTLNPAIVAVGSDWLSKDIYKQYDMTPQDFDDLDAVLIYLPYTAHISSTMLKERLKLIH